MTIIIEPIRTGAMRREFEVFADEGDTFGEPSRLKLGTYRTARGISRAIKRYYRLEK